MSVVVELNPKVENALKKKADAKGSKLGEYVASVLEEHVNQGLTYQEIMAPLWRDFEESDMTEEDLDVFVDDLRDKVWRENHEGRRA